MVITNLRLDTGQSGGTFLARIEVIGSPECLLVMRSTRADSQLYISIRNAEDGVQEQTVSHTSLYGMPKTENEGEENKVEK